MTVRNDPDQTEVIAFLTAPASYEPVPDKVERIDTHGAMVFLAGEKAYKIKRAVQLAYLDFSTLEKRRAACEREVEVNRRTAPHIYLGTVPITRGKKGALHFGGDGETIEWAVKMARFDQRDLLDRMAEEGRLPLGLMAPLTDHIATYHDAAPVERSGANVAGLSRVVANVTAALETVRDRLGEKEVAKFNGALRAAFTGNEARMKQRAADGFVRRCHGDLHLRNIVLVGGVPTLFDAIEFDERLATIDVLYDLAFLLMDLWHRDEKAHANAVLNRYLWRAGAEENIDGLALLPLYLAIRAGVRAMVALDRLLHVAAKEREAVLHEVSEYFVQAEGFLNPAPPRLIAVGGLSGTGKSTLAAALAPSVGAAPGAFHLRSDVERKLLFAVRPEESLGEEAYAEGVSEKVYAALNEKAGRALRAGHSVVVDAVFARAHQREAAERVAADAGVPFDGLWLTAPEAELIDRVGKRAGDASDADAAVVRRQLDYDIGDLEWQMLDAGGPAEATRAAAAAALGIIRESGPKSG
jgi:aminoglycoside phosphotransferase family enzyme/predicted kinase